MRRAFSDRRGQYLIRLSIFLLIAILVTGMAGCTVQPVQYSLTIYSTEGGTVTNPSTGRSVYDKGTVVNLTARANESYAFDKWTGDVGQIADINAADTTIVMNGNYRITANFVRQYYTLTISSSPGGNVTTPGEGTFTYTGGTLVELVAVADDGYQFASWTDGPSLPIADALAATTTIVMDLDYSITANFAVPTPVQDWYDLNTVRNSPEGLYTLMNDLNSTTAGYDDLAGPAANGGKGWQPIGSFAGVFRGGGYNIGDLSINYPQESSASLFGSIGGGITNLGVINATVTGHYSAAALAGYSGGTVTNCYSVSNVNGSENIGGLIGSNYGTVTNCYSVSNVNGSEHVGGLVGENGGTVTNCHSVSDVNGDEAVGGLVGWNYATVTNCSASGSASSSHDYVGGLIGDNYGTVSGCHATGTAAGSYAGGLVGFNFGGYVTGVVTNCYSTGNVTSTAYAGGLIGYNYKSMVSSCYSTGSVTGGLFAAGGLIGENSYSGVTSCYSTGAVTGQTAGGLVGENYFALVTSSFWDTETSGQATSDGGTGRTTAEMQDITTFSAATWDIIGVADPDIRNPAYIWNIVDGVTYPFLSWQS
jgi:hypothetical protein